MVLFVLQISKAPRHRHLRVITDRRDDRHGVVDVQREPSRLRKIDPTRHRALKDQKSITDTDAIIIVIATIEMGLVGR